MAGLLYTNRKSIRTGVRPFESVLNELIDYYGSVRQVCKVGHIGRSTMDTLRTEHKLGRATMQKLMDMHAKMREEQIEKKNAKAA